MNQTIIKTSKFLSFVLRHGPEQIGLVLDSGGWVEVEVLIARAKEHGRHLTRSLIREVVVTNNKKRFALSEDESRIRASQGHSVQVDLGLEPITPPDTLYHGTATQFLQSIRDQGLQPRGRQHVHLSAELATAKNVGGRHGKPVVLEVDAGRMAREGFRFYISANGVWLSEEIPPEYLS